MILKEARRVEARMVEADELAFESCNVLQSDLSPARR